MIIKSMSRKEPTFGQLMAYIDRDGGEELYRIRYNVAGRDRTRIRKEFETNALLMRARKGGVFLYHEIISITRTEGLSLAEQKERLHQIAQEYVAARAPRNLCYGGLHSDKKHSLHYHLMISANRHGEEKRHRLSKEQFRDVQISLERHVRATMPELQQKLAIEKQAEARIPKQEVELKRRTGWAPEREAVAERVRKACGNAKDRETLLQSLSKENVSLYVRGSLLGVTDAETGKRHRLRSLGDDLAPLIERHLAAEQVQEQQVEAKAEPKREKPDQSRPAVEKEKKPEVQRETKPVQKRESDAQQKWREDIERRRKQEKTLERDDEQER